MEQQQAATTSSASVGGWSPLRTAKKASGSVLGSPSSVSYVQTSEAGASAGEHPSLQSPKQVTHNFKALRTHGLVSNSIFKQIDSPTSTSPLAISPKKLRTLEGMPSPSVGLGITTTPTRTQRRPSHEKQHTTHDENNSPYQGSATKPERKIPRKSLGRLHESHYVSNSVFRGSNGGEAPVSVQTPSPSSSGKGLLTSNRLYGPRYMNVTPTGSPSTTTAAAAAGSPTRKERRKTVTFDEILDVQEFEHEISFDTLPDEHKPESDHEHEQEVSQPPVLRVVNAATPVAVAVASSVSSVDSEPELDASRDDDDSRDASSAEGPPSPGADADAEAEASLRRLSAAERVDCMMDELLSQDILNSPTLRPQNDAAQPTTLPEPLTSTPLPLLPAWTPLDLDVDVKSIEPLSLFSTDSVNRSQTQPQILAQITPPPAAPAAEVARTASVRGGRPHISRDAILQRVAREKAKEASPTTPAAAVTRTTPTRMPRGSEPAARRPTAPTSSTPPPQHQQREYKPLPAPSPVKHALQHTHVQSPLESLGTELQNAYPFHPDSPQSTDRPTTKAGPPRRKRSMSTSDTPKLFTSNDSAAADSHQPAAESTPADPQPKLTGRKSIGADLAKSKQALDASLQRAIDGGFQHTLEQEFSKIYEKDELPYKVKDCGTFQGVDDKVTHSATAGDVDSGKAWKKLRRPSDMNEYKKEMRELHDSHQSQARPMPGKVFVLVDSFTPIDLPVPTTRPTLFHCILDNGLHMVKTATVPLRAGRGNVSPIGQEFELIQHRNLEFSLTLVVQRDAHLVEPSGPPSPTRKEHGSPTLKGFSRFFSSPKKQALKREQQQQQERASVATHTTRVEPMLAYINREGAFGRTGIVFERVAPQCLAKCLVLDLPVHGASNMAMSVSGPSSLASRSGMGDDFRANLDKVRGTLRLKLFYLPPLPTVPRDRMPENLADCIRGMQDAAWHRAQPWLSGTLTQLGGDCASWRRRPTKAQGQYLICSSTVTKKPTVKIDLSKAVCVEEVGNHVSSGSMLFPTSRASQMTMTRTRTMASHTTVSTLLTLANEEEDADANYHVDRCFRITFSDGERIQFFADTEEEKAKWVQVVTDMVDNGVPANPLWAQAVLETLHANAAPIVVERKPGSQPSTQSQRLTSTVAEEDEEEIQAPATPKKDVPVRPLHHQRAQSASVGNTTSSPFVETPRRMGSNRPARIPAPPRTPTAPIAAGTTSSEIVLSTRTSSTMLASPRRMAASEIRVTVNDPSNRAAFDRLKRAGVGANHGHHRSRTEDLTAASRRY